MKHIVKNMLAYWKYILVIFVLLVVQALCDLNLPLYTSNIIDVGIISSGVEHIVPERITEEDYEIAKIPMSQEELDIWENLYEKSDLEKEGIYKLKKFDENYLNEIDEKLLSVLVLNYQVGRMEENAFKGYIKISLINDQNSGEYADLVDEMSLDDISEMLQMDVKYFEDEGDDGIVRTYVDIRPLMSMMIDAGWLEPSMFATAKNMMENAIEKIGAKTLKSMGTKYAIECNNKAGVDVGDIQISYLWSAGGRMLLISLIMMITSIIVSYLASKVGAGVGRDLRGKVFSSVMGYSDAEINRFSPASLITRATNDVQQIQFVTVLLLRMVLYAPIIGIGGIIKVSQTGADMGWIIVLAVVVLTGFVLILVSLAMPKFKVMQKKIDSLNLVAREILTGLLVIRAFGREKKEETRFDAANVDLKRTQLFTNRVMTFMMPGMTLIMNLVVALIVWVSAHQIDEGILQVGTMTAFITYTMQIVISFLMLTALSIILPRAGVAAERIDEVISTRSTINNPENPKTVSHVKGVVEFKHVSFKYPGAEENVLEDIDFVAKPGEVTAIIGGTGCGKSTLVNLIPRFYDVTEGSITIDGVDIRDLELKTLRKSIGFVPQKGVLFSGTIGSNICFGNDDATSKQMEEAADIAQATEFIAEKTDQYESHIAQGGNNVSGGQKQRLAIARAIVMNPRIYIFDDIFSALDMKTDVKLREALKSKVANSTEIIVAQRISTILHADQIIVLEDGKIVGKGTHEELLKSCTVYRQIAVSQLSAGELGLSVEEVQK